MSQLVNYSIIEAGLRALADKAHESAVAQAEGKPILFETNGSTQAVTKYNGAPLTVADVQGTGVYQFWFERDTNTLQIMSGIV